jgi:hypothetical protein
MSPPRIASSLVRYDDEDVLLRAERIEKEKQREREREKESKEESREEERACMVAVVACRRSEGTHPINKTTRVTIEFNRERNGFLQLARRVEARRDPRSKSPSTYAPLLFIVPNFHFQWTAIAGRTRERERERERERAREGEREQDKGVESEYGERGKERKTVFVDDREPPAGSVLRRGERHDTDLVFFPPALIGKAQLLAGMTIGTVGGGKGNAPRKGIDISNRTEEARILPRSRRSIERGRCG